MSHCRRNSDATGSQAWITVQGRILTALIFFEKLLLGSVRLNNQFFEGGHYIERLF